MCIGLQKSQNDWLNLIFDKIEMVLNINIIWFCNINYLLEIRIN